MRTARIFSHKHVIGVEMDIDNGTFINDPNDENQIGSIIAIDQLVITAEAKELLKTAKREGGSFAPIMILEDSVGFLGYGYCAFDLNDPVLSRDCDVSVLDKIATEEMDIPDEFIDYVEGN